MMMAVWQVLVVGAVPVAGVGRAEDVEDRARRGGGEPVHVPAGLREQHQGVARRAQVGVHHPLRQPQYCIYSMHNLLLLRRARLICRPTICIRPGSRQIEEIKLTAIIASAANDGGRAAAGVDPIVRRDVQRAQEKLAEHRHPGVVVQRDHRA